MSNLLPANTAMGPVTLRVRDLDGLTRYYQQGIGLELIASGNDSVELGTAGQTLLVLQHAPELRHAGSHEAGLFHTAFLFQSQKALANAVRNLAFQNPGSFTGSADHLVSEAFYFDDPEGNGVELYFDRDRSKWSWAHGQIEMGTFALDPNDYLQKYSDASNDFAPGSIGHVHLSVGNIAQAQDFYVNKLGFETTLNWGGTALFVSAGGYHHHMAMNIWRSRGAGKRQLALGLGEVKIKLTQPDDLAAAKDRLSFHGAQIQDTKNGLVTFDPWDNQITLSLS